jgi:hypothetical protein
MTFIQVIEYRTTQFEAMESLGKEWEAAAVHSGISTARRRVLCRDRDDNDRYFNIVFFDSFEDAMTNSDLPVTSEFAGRMRALADGDPVFYNLDVVEQVEY